MKIVVVLPVLAAEFALGQTPLVDVPVATLQGGDTRFSRSMCVVDAADYTVWRGSAKAENDRWQASQWVWKPESPYDELPITPLPDLALGDSAAEGFFCLPDVGDEVIVGFTTTQGGLGVPCVWKGDELGPYTQALLPALAGGGRATTVNQVSVPDGMTLLIGGFTRTAQGVERPALWSELDGNELILLPAPQGNARVTHIGDEAVYGFTNATDPGGYFVMARWTLEDDEWSLEMLDIDPPQGYESARITCGIGDDLLAGEWTTSDGSGVAGFILIPSIGLEVSYTIGADDGFEVASINGFFGTETFTYTLLGSITDGLSNTIAWNRADGWPGVASMSPIPVEEMYTERTAVAGRITSSGFVVIGATGTMADGTERASVLVGLSEGCPADCNGDGILNILDFVCFQGKFVAGCP